MMNKLLVAAVLLCVGDMVLAYGSLYDSDRDNVEEIREDVEILNNEMQRLDDKVDRILNILDSEFGKEAQETKWPLLELLNASRTWSPLTNETTYTVCYHDYGSGDDVTVEWFSFPKTSHRMEDKSEMTPAEGGKIVCTSVTPTKDFQSAAISVQRKDILLSYTMHMYKYGDYFSYTSVIEAQKAAYTNQTVTDIQLNTIQVISDGDVVYDVYRDRQAVVKVRTHFLDKYSTDKLQVRVELVNSTTNTTDRTGCNRDDGDSSSSSCKLLLSSKKLWDGMEVDIGIDTRIGGMMLSGYATVSATTDIRQENEPTFFQEITVTQDVVIRPTSQPGPYPDNFLNVNLTLEDDDLKVCQIDNMDLCFLYCSAKGNNIEEVNFFGSVNGTTELIPSTSDSQSESQDALLNRRYKSIQVPKPDHLLQPEPEIRNFTCTARNHDGLTASTNISVVVIDQIRIVNDETYVEKNDTALMAVCTVQGYPLANVTLRARTYTYNNYRHSEKELDFDKIVVLQNTTSLKVKVTGYLTLTEMDDAPQVECWGEAKYSSPVSRFDIGWMSNYTAYNYSYY